ncbi:hypothetical protein Desti_5338 [Desulfomonile tiedjei DSM 6799]|uniref:Uncharacterized protein n=1 Tax=Desulfomonile tiedjei (strain ATCC 49306 / DSM 6799 / DCB-1) TaxID=706587 RepID=I4CED6_DESTA|nr:hypothetical protein Desti_5338 [Desulfomonile tiedjei DSM 6799]
MLNQGTLHFLIIADHRLFCERNYSSGDKKMQISCLSPKKSPWVVKFSRSFLGTGNKDDISRFVDDFPADSWLCKEADRSFMSEAVFFRRRIGSRGESVNEDVSRKSLLCDVAAKFPPRRKSCQAFGSIRGAEFISPLTLDQDFPNLET